VRDAATDEALAGGEARLDYLLWDAWDRYHWAAGRPHAPAALYRAVAVAYLRLAGVEWRGLRGQAAWDVAQRACALADGL